MDFEVAINLLKLCAKFVFVYFLKEINLGFHQLSQGILGL